jgi:cell division protein FtsI (penicillin-binding protein 3)
MTRIPLRPLARILRARAKGENPDTIERENLRLRHEALRDRGLGRAQLRLLFLCLFFFSAFTVIGARMGMLAASEPMEPRSATSGAAITAGRADIVDRNGRILATNMLTHALYVQTKDLVDPGHVARELAKIFPDLDADTMERCNWCMRSAIRDCCLARVRCGFTRTALWQPMFWAGRLLVPRAWAAPK